MKTISRQERISNCVTLLSGKPDFPTFSEHVQAIMAAVDGEAVSARELTDLIIRDYSLSLLLLRRANAHNVSGRPILSITHAVVMLGIEAVGHVAASLLIFEHFHNKPPAVRELMMLSMLTASHVQQIARRVPDVQPQEAYLCGLVRNLGELLVSYYMPIDYARILKRAEERKLPLARACSDILQFSFEDLGTAVANYWAMPQRVAECQRATAPLRLPGKGHNLLMAAVSLGHEITTAVYRMEPEAGAARLKSALQDHYGVLPLARQEVDTLLANSIGETQKTFGAMGIHINELRLQAQTSGVLEAMNVEDEAPVEGRAQVAATGETDILGQLAKEVRTLVAARTNLDLNTLILMVLEAIYRGAGFDRALFAFVNLERTYIEGRLGLGDGADRLVEKFRFRMAASGGPVSAALLSRRSLFGNQSSSLARFLGCSFVGLYPVVVGGQVVGCIYMENEQPRAEPDEGQLRHLGQLRDSVVLAMRQVRGSA